MKESTRDEFLTLAEQKRNASTNPIWAAIADKLSQQDALGQQDQDALLSADESDALRHEALKKIAYLREQREKGCESSIKLHLLEAAYRDQYGELPK